MGWLGVGFVPPPEALRQQPAEEQPSEERLAEEQPSEERRRSRNKIPQALG